MISSAPRMFFRPFSCSSVGVSWFSRRLARCGNPIQKFNHLIRWSVRHSTRNVNFGKESKDGQPNESGLPFVFQTSISQNATSTPTKTMQSAKHYSVSHIVHTSYPQSAEQQPIMFQDTPFVEENVPASYNDKI